MNLNQLYYFKELAEQKSFSKASEKLFISQPSLSNSIKSLEKELGCKLINRHDKDLSLTETGIILYQTANIVVDNINTAKRKIENKNRQAQKTVNLACIPTAIGTRLPKIINDYRQEIEDPLKIIYHDNMSNGILEGLRTGKYDLGICSHEEKYDDLIYIPFYSEEIIMITSKEHEFAQANITSMSVEELNGENIYTYANDVSIGRNITESLLALCPDLRIINIMHDELTLAGYITANNLIGIVADTPFLDSFNLNKVHLNLPQNTRIVYLVYNPKMELSLPVLDFLDFLKKYGNDID